MRDSPPRPPLTDDDARRIAEGILREVRQPPDPDNRQLSSPSAGSQSPDDADEDRIERALIELGALFPDQTWVGSRRERGGS